MSKANDMMILDVNDIDDAIVEEVGKVNWHLVTESDAARFGLALGLFRDSVHAYQLRRTAFTTTFGGVIGIATMAIIFAAFGVSPAAAIAGITGAQLGRACHMWWKARQAKKHANEMQHQVTDAAKHLAAQYPNE
jgi:hypothetical protein